MAISQRYEEVGKELVEYAEQHAVFSAQRGLVEEIFPAIYQASRRMSTRAISNWLKDQKGIKLSAVTIAKALREANKYWQDIYDEIEPQARMMAVAYDVEERDLLVNEKLFEALKGEPPRASGRDEAEEILAAGEILAANWYGRLDEAARGACLAAVRAAEQREDQAEEENNEHKPK